jgi:uncharacterized protein (DUF4415 family)
MKAKEQIVRHSSQELREMSGRGETLSNFEKAAAIDDSHLDDGLPSDFWDTAHVIHHKRKKLLTLRIDEDLVDWFREEAKASHSKGYQTMMHSVLLSYRQERERKRHTPS